MKEYRVGHGYDVHKFVDGRPLILGGIDIPFELGLMGHSDADVLVHAIMDSLLGAAGLGDIGRHFPDTSEDFLNISSLNLLVRVRKMLEENKADVINIDATVVMQKPKISLYFEKMINNIAFALNISPKRINIKATTEEKLGFTGRLEGVSAHAVSMIQIEIDE